MACDQETDLANWLASCTLDPLRFVLGAFPWGEPGELAHESGPREWQSAVLAHVRDCLQGGMSLDHAIAGAILIACASGHGIGKSALVAWLILWAESTREDTKCVVTANTEPQLRTKTWPEVAKWHRLCICSHWFVCTATSLYSRDPAHERTWRADAITWSENNTEAFAGLHNKGSRILLVFDEASAIADRVWEVAEGALTDADTQIIWAVFGNPTKNTGRFRECFGRLAHRWNHRQIDSRTVEGANKEQLAKWVEDYGEDSDFCRVRIKGQFPRAGSMQLIPSDLVLAASKRNQVSGTLYDPLIMGIDVARFGDDESSIRFRRGKDAHSIRGLTRRGIDTMTLAALCAQLIEMHHPDAIFIDQTGIGGAVVDRLRQLGFKVVGVDNGGTAANAYDGVERAANKGAEMWLGCKRWLADGGGIEADPDLMQQLEGREYGYNVHSQIVLEKKDDMKKRGLASPDRADALCLTFAHPVAARDIALSRRTSGNQARMDYNPLR